MQIQNLKSIWEESNLQLDIPLIDLQHIWLLSIILRLEEFIDKHEKISKEQEEIKSTLSEVVDYIRESFSIEENLFSKFYFPESNDHIQQHRHFLIQIAEIHDIFNSNNPGVEISKILQLLKTWLSDHIKKEDKKYKLYLDNSKADIKNFTKELFDKKLVNITLEQSNLYNQITSHKEIKEIINEDLISNIKQIWNTFNLSIQIPIIDIQHIWLVKMVVELDTALKSRVSIKKNEVFHQVIISALEYTQEHFLTEELLMKQFSYSEINNHIHQHKHFINFVKLRYEESKKGDILAASSLVQDLKEWLLSHIALEDKKLKNKFLPILPEVTEYIKQLQREGTITVKNSHINIYKAVLNLRAIPEP